MELVTVFIVVTSVERSQPRSYGWNVRLTSDSVSKTACETFAERQQHNKRYRDADFGDHQESSLATLFPPTNQQSHHAYKETADNENGCSKMEHIKQGGVPVQSPIHVENGLRRNKDGQNKRQDQEYNIPIVPIPAGYCSFAPAFLSIARCTHTRLRNGSMR
jgi:hypothetical protein